MTTTTTNGTTELTADQAGQAVSELRRALQRKAACSGVDTALRDFFKSHEKSGVGLPMDARKRAQAVATERKREIERQKKGQAREVVNKHDNVALLSHIGVLFLAGCSMAFNAFSNMVGLARLKADESSLLNVAAPSLPGIGDLTPYEQWGALIIGAITPVAVLICGAVLGRLIVRPQPFCRRVAIALGCTAVFILFVSVTHCADAIHLLTGSSYLVSVLTAIGIDTSIVALEVSAVSVKIVEE